MNAALMLVKDNAFIVGFIFAAWAIWKVAGWKSVVDASIQLQSQNIERLTESVQNLTNNVQNLTNNFSRLDARVDALSEKIDTKIAALSDKIDTQIATLSKTIDTKIAALSDKIDTKIADLSDKMDTKIAALSEKMDTKIAALSDKMDTKIADLSEKMDTKIADLSEKMDTKIADLSASMSKTIDTQVATLSEKIDTQVATLSDKIDTKIADLSASMSKTIDTKIADLSDKIDTRYTALSGKVDGLQNMFTVLLGRQTAKSASPRTLTDYGAKLSLEIDAPSLAAYYAARLQEKTGSMNAWQIQELCFNHAEHEIMKDLQQHDIDRYNQITMCAYREGIDLSQIMLVVGIVMRDQLLQQTGQLPSAQTAPAVPGGDSTLRNIASLTGQTANQET